MASVRGTANHTYNVEDRLGQGATGNVFKGLSKRGEFHALKVFEPFAVKDINREVTALQQLKHENIIRFIGVEDEMMSRKIVVVMEYCEGGSLASYLREPDYMFGLPDVELLLLLKHLVSGMEHLRSQGFIHRDIKPGNILRSITKDGSSLFKLSDFGTARPLEDDEYFKSLVGTEEYLHPDLFNAAFMQEGKSMQFPHSVDLWSVGATIYNAATGSVPFSPFDGRRDHRTMFKMINKKPEGVIGARQDRPNGQIQWQYELPDTCQLSRGLQKLVVGMLVALFKSDPRQTWTFEQFFQETKTFLSYEAVSVLALFPHHSPYDAVYLPQLNSIEQMKEEIGKCWKSTGVKLYDTWYGESCLSEWLEDNDQIFDLPPTDCTTPIIALPAELPNCEEIQVPEPSMSTIVSEELSFTESSVQSVLQIGREMCGIVALIDRRTAALAMFQQHLLKLRQRLRFQLRRQMKEADRTFNIMMELFDVIRGTADMSSWSHQEKDNFRQLKRKMSAVDEVLKNAATTVKLPFEDNQWNFDGNKCMQQTRRTKDETQSWLNEVKDLKKSTDRSRFSSQHSEKCLVTIRCKLEQAYKRAVCVWSDHCFQKIFLLRGSFLDWYRSYLEAIEGLKMCQEYLSVVVSLITQLFKSCVNRSQGLVTRKVSKSLLAHKQHDDKDKFVDFRDMLQDLTNNLEEPEVFGVPLP